MEKNCESCRWWLGGIYDCCRLNLESECRGGEYEAWEDKKGKGVKADEDRPDR